MKTEIAKSQTLIEDEKKDTTTDSDNDGVDYGSANYWETRYANYHTFDWLENYQSLKPLLKDYLTADSRMLIIGCGNAEFSEDLYDDGYVWQWNIDLSQIVIKQMIARNRKRPEIKWEVMDCRELDYPSKFFDIVIDKSIIDTLLCGRSPNLDVARMMTENCRVLKDRGVYFAVSYGAPENRVPHLIRPNLSFDRKDYILYP